jgi:hypothetical protein
LSIARVSPTITTTTTDDDDAMAPTDVARVIPSRTSPDPAKLGIFGPDVYSLTWF